MREDMPKVIVERPRLDPRNARKGRRLDLDDLPSGSAKRLVTQPRTRSASRSKTGPSHKGQANSAGLPYQE
jgi:hypothetical protein